MTPEETSNFKSESSIRRFCAIVVNCFCRFGNFVRRLMRLDHHNSENYEICDIETTSTISGATTVSGFTISALEESHIRSDLDTRRYAIHTPSNETQCQPKVRSNCIRSRPNSSPNLNVNPNSDDCKPIPVIKAVAVNSEPLMIVDGKSMDKPSKCTTQMKDVQNVNGIDKRIEPEDVANFMSPKEQLNKTVPVDIDICLARSNNEALDDNFRRRVIGEGFGRHPKGKFIIPETDESPTRNSLDKSKRIPEKSVLNVNHGITSSGESSGKRMTTGEIQDTSQSEIDRTIVSNKHRENTNNLYSEDERLDQHPTQCQDFKPNNSDINISDQNIPEFKEDSLCNRAAFGETQKRKKSNKSNTKSSPIISSCLSALDRDVGSPNKKTSPSIMSRKPKIISPARIFRRLSGISKLPIPTRVGKNEKLKESNTRDKLKTISVRGSMSDTDSAIENIKERSPCVSSSTTKSENSIETSREKLDVDIHEPNNNYDLARPVYREPNECGERVESLSRQQNSPDKLKPAGDGSIIKEDESSITVSSLPLSKLSLSIKNLTRKFILLEVFSDQSDFCTTITIQDIIFYELCMELCADPDDRKLLNHVDRKLVTHLLRSSFHFTDRQLNVELVKLFRDALAQYSQSHQNKVQLETKLRHLRLMRNENFRERINQAVSGDVLDVTSESGDESDDSEVNEIKTFNDVGTCTNIEEPTIAYITATASNNKRFIPRDPTRYIKRNEKCIQVDESTENELGEAKQQEDLYSIAYQQEMFNIGTYRMDDHVNVEKAKKGCRPEEKQKVKTRGIPNKHLESSETDHEVFDLDSSYIEDFGEEATAFGEKTVTENKEGKSQKIDYKAEPVILDMRHMEEVPVQVIQNRRKSSPPSSGKKKRKNKKRLSNENVVKKLDLSFHISGQM